MVSNSLKPWSLSSHHLNHFSLVGALSAMGQTNGAHAAIAISLTTIRSTTRTNAHRQSHTPQTSGKVNSIISNRLGQGVCNGWKTLPQLDCGLSLICTVQDHPIPRSSVISLIATRKLVDDRWLALLQPAKLVNNFMTKRD